MPNEIIEHVNVNGTTYDIKDNISGYTTNTGTVTSIGTGTGLTGGPITTSGTISLDTTYAITASDISVGTSTANKLVSAKTIADAIGGLGGGTITSVTAGTGLTGGGTSGAVTVSHSNSVTAQTTQALYPIKIDAQGHISAYGTAVTVPTVNNGALKLQKNSNTASSVYTANQSTDTTLKYTTTSVGSASNWSAGSATTLGTAISADDITAWTTNTPTAIDTTKFNGGSFTRGTFSGGSFTQGTDSFTANTPTAIAYSLGSATATASNPTTLTMTITSGVAASFTQGTDSFTAATHAADSFTAAALSSGFYSAGVAASLSYTSRSIPNVTSAGTAPSLTITSTTVVNDISKV